MVNLNDNPNMIIQGEQQNPIFFDCPEPPHMLGLRAMGKKGLDAYVCSVKYC